MASLLGNRTALIGALGDLQVGLSVSSFLADGPEKSTPRLDARRLAFMQEAWAAPVAAAAASASVGAVASLGGDILLVLVIFPIDLTQMV